MESRWSKQREDEQADRETDPDAHTAIMSGKQTEREIEGTHAQTKEESQTCENKTKQKRKQARRQKNKHS